MDQLEAARAQGYLELDFPIGSTVQSEAIAPLLAVADQWSRDNIEHGRHSIVVGHRGDEHFVLWSRKKGREFHYVMLQIWNAMLRVSNEPVWSIERLSLIAAAKTREQAVRAAKRLVEIDRTPRDPSLEIGVAEELKSAPTIIEA